MVVDDDTITYLEEKSAGVHPLQLKILSIMDGPREKIRFSQSCYLLSREA